MEQHPVPQQIASYEFHLVGDMTLKQFGYLAAGAIVGLIFYSSSLAGFIKWPLAFVSGFLGFAFAFLPIEERPLSQWLIAFSKAIFSPTQFLWKKQIREPELSRPSGSVPITPPPPMPLADRKKLNEYLTTLPYQAPKTFLDQKEEDYLQRLSALGQNASPFPTILPEKPIQVKKAPVFEAKTSLQLPIPAPPTRPNILVGMVLDSTNQMIEGAILEIRRSDEIPVRALKTNKLGQFQIVTPLENDTYEIEIEKEGYQFDIIKIEVKGEIIPPIEIRAKNLP